MDADNWLGGNVANTGVEEASRISVQNGSNSPLIYTTAQGTTIYTGGDANRSLFIASGVGGAMTITGGTFDSRGSNSDGISNGADGSLAIDGGAYVNTNGGTSTFLVKYGGSGTGTLTIVSGSFTTGTLQFGADSGSGVVNLDGGTLTTRIIQEVNNPDSTFNFNGGTLVAGAASTTFMQGLDTANVLADGAVIDTNGFDITIAQALLDGGTGGGLTKTGAGTLTLSGANTYTGVTNVSQGTLRMGSDAALGTADSKTVIQSGATLDIAGHRAGATGASPPSDERIEVSGSGVAGLGALYNSGGTQTLAFRNVTLLGDTSFGGTGRWDLRYGTFAVGGHTITKVGTNAVCIVSATVTNPGDVNVEAGMFRIEGSTNYNAAAPVTITVASGAKLDYWSTNIAHNQNIVLNGGTVSANSNTSPSLSGTIALNTGTSTIGVGNEYGSPTLTITGQITGDGGFRLIGHNSHGGTGVLILTNTSNDYAGTTAINSGTLKLGAAGVIPDGSGRGNVIVNAGTTAAGTVDLSGFNETINGLDGSSGNVLGQVVNSATGTTSTLTVGSGDASGTFGGVLRDNAGTGGTLALTKTGSGTQVLSGANTYTGLTDVQAGVLRITNGSALGDIAGGTKVASGAQLELAGDITVSGETITISGSGANIKGALQTQSGENTWDGNVILGSNGTRVGASGDGNTLIISGDISEAGNNYKLAVRNDDNGGTTILSGANNTYGGETHVVVGLLKIDGGDNRLPTGTVLRVGNTSNVATATFDLNAYNQEVAGLVSDGTLMSRVVTNSAAAPSILTVNNAGNNTYSGVVEGNLALTKAGSSQLTLSGANTYTGLTTVNAGTLLVTGSLANNGSSHVQIASAGTVFGSSDPTIVRRVADGDTFAGLGSQIIGTGTFGTEADLVAGSNGSGSSLDVAMAWRTFDSAETSAFPALTNPLSDIVQLTGMGTTETDPFVLQLSYDSSLVQSYHDGMFLAWLSPTDGWTNAVNGNVGFGIDAVAGATGSWDSIADPGDLASYLGSWGVDSTSETVWAVLNHNSQFAVLAIPEPSSLLMVCIGLVGLLLSVRRRR